MNKDIDKIIKAVEDIKRVIHYKDYQENIEIMGLFDSEKEIYKLIERLNDSDRQNEIYRHVESGDPHNALLNIKRAIEKNKLTRRRKLFVRVISSIAVAAAVFAVTMLIYDYQSQVVEDKSQLIVSSNKRENRDIMVPTLITYTGDSLTLTSNEKVYRKKTEKSIVNSSSVMELKMEELVVPSTYIQSIILEDGTEVIVNAGSSLRFPSSFAADKREVELSGEAYFKVAKSGIPFYVRLKDMDVKVYGTEFNINANQLDCIETVLIEGSVGVSTKEGVEVMMKPNQVVVSNTKTSENIIKEVNVEDYISWTKLVFLYKERPLELVLHDIVAWYGVEFEAQTDLNYLITCRMSRESSLNDILAMIELATPIKFVKLKINKYAIEKI